MEQKILIVEDEFIEANNLQMIVERAGYRVCGIARSVSVALKMLGTVRPDLVLLDIFLKGKQTGIDLARELVRQKIAFVYLSANSDKKTLAAAKATQPYGFLVKPFREKDVLVTLDIAHYLHQVRLSEAVANGWTGDETVATKEQEQKDLPDIVGRSLALNRVLQLVQAVAPSDTSVLILGESGTGKEMIAEYIHQLSPRNDKPLIRVNCASLSSTLIESELFGHERGAFTGAIERRVGRFEQADGGTLFLDEIGDIPVDIQVKLLRVLQEREIQRIGSGDTVKVNVRIIAATNKDLEVEVAENRFRIDLYYRLNVFPIWLPVLRDRKEDIPALVQHFIRKYAVESGRPVTGISGKLLQELERYSWPGNVRELGHFIERAVLLTSGSLIEDAELVRNLRKAPVPNRKQGGGIKTMDENEKDNIIAALRQTNGKIYGPGGAAELLGVSVSTLNSRIRKLGVSKQRVFST